MGEYILLMYNDAPDQSKVNNPDNWEKYVSALHAGGQFTEVSAIGGGLRCKKHAEDQTIADKKVVGSIRIRAESPQAAKYWLVGNPVYEAGGTVEIRALLRD